MKRFLLLSLSTLLSLLLKNTFLVAQTREQAFESSFQSVSLSKWSPGMKFIFQSGWAKDFYPSKKSKKKIEDLDGKVAVFKNVKLGFTNLCSFDIEGEIWVSNTLYEPVRGVAYLEYLQNAKDSLVSKQVYVLNDFWTKKGDAHRSKFKFFKVTIENIKIGASSSLPYVVEFTDQDGVKGYTEIQIGKFNVLALDQFTFSTTFSFENPRLKYPTISDENWGLIQHEKIKPGMTRLECKLSYGEPKKVNKTITENELTEQWVYDNDLLYFTNDRLTAIQEY